MFPPGHKVDLTRQPRIDISLSLSLASNLTAGQNITSRTGEAYSSSSSPQARPRDIIGNRIILTRDQEELKLEDNLRWMVGGGAQEEEKVDRRQISQSELYKNILMSVMSVPEEK